MARFNAAVMDGASDPKFQNRYNYLLDLLDMGYIVEKRINGVPIKIDVSSSVGLAFYQGGGPTGWVYRGGLELINENLFLTANAIKGVELSDRYLLWEDPPGVVGDPSLQLYDNDIRVGHLSFSDTMVRMSSIPTSSGDASSMVLVAAQYDANPQNYASFELYGNKLSDNYANISVYSNPMTGGGDYAQYIFSTTGIVAKLNGTDRTVWHSGNDGSGSTLDADTVDGFHAVTQLPVCATFTYPSVATNATVSPQLGEYQVGIVCVVWYGSVNTSAYYMVHSWASGARYYQQLGTTQGDAAPAATVPVLNADGTFTIKNDHDTYALTIAVKFIKFF